MTTNNITVSIVIVTWNCKAYAEECLLSLRGQTCEHPVQIIVLDNASSDGTPEMIAASFPEVRLIRSPRNLGFSQGNNVALREAAGEYVCLVNPDVNVSPPCIARLVEEMERRTNIGLIGPRMLGRDGQAGRSTMRFPGLWNTFTRALGLDALFPHSRWFGGFLMKDFRHDASRDVDVLNGWFWMTRRQALEEVGGLDDQLFMYGDDLDWCRRFHNAGWRVVFFAEAEAVHYGGGTTAKAPIPFYLALQRANLQYWRKHHGAPAMAAYFLLICLHHLVRVAGYAAAWPIVGEQSQARYKLRRSLASLLWMSGLGSSRLGEIR